MQQDPLARATRRQVDETALARNERRLRQGAPAPWLHSEVASRMAQRLGWLRQPPSRVLDWTGDTGGSGPALAQALPAARVEPLRDPASGAQARSRWRLFDRSRGTTEADAAQRPFDLLWANMSLHRAADPALQFQQWSRCVRVGGLLMFSTLGPATLAGLRQLYEAAGWGPPLAPLPDMHDLGDMLLQAGFEDPVMDQETVTLTWSQPVEMWKEIGTWGSNAHPQRFAGLRTPRWRQRWERAVAATGTGAAGASATVELVYGHALRSSLHRAKDGQARIGVDELRQQLAARRGASS